MMMKKTICLMAVTAFALAGSAGCGDSGTGGAGGGTDEGGAPGSGGGGGSPATEVNGCTKADAEDQLAAASVDIAWTNPTQECIRVSAGTVVNWNVDGSFATHPLSGGEPGSPVAGDISDSDQTGATASVTFDAAGEYPFFCTIHNGTMQGVIYVE
jgi:plastocyanin